MASPTKRTLTDENHAAIVAANVLFHDSTPEDLALRLRNLGSRIRKSVNDGYPVTCYPGTSVPATPYTSPTRVNINPATPQQDYIFRSNNEILAEIMYTPTNKTSSATRTPSPTPSPRKRGRTEADFDDGINHSLLRGGDLEMDEADIDGEDDPVVFILGPPAGRPIKPLRKSRYFFGLSPAGLAGENAASFFTTNSNVPSKSLDMETDDMDWFSRRT